MPKVTSANSERSDNFRKIERNVLNDISELSCGPTRKLYEWWSQFLPNFPTREDFDITQVPSLASNIFLIEVLQNGKFLYRLCGENVGNLVGRQYRMVEISHDSEDFADQKLAEYLSMLIEEKKPYRCHGDLSFFDKEFLSFESVDCPLVDHNGQITHIVGVLCEGTICK